MPSHPLEILFIGGTGTISAAAVREAVAQGMRVTVVNRGTNSRRRVIPSSVRTLTGDIRRPASVESAIGDQVFDAVINFLSYDSSDAREAIELFSNRTRQYIHISTASIYQKPIAQVPLVESTPRRNPYLAYARAKIAAEDTLLGAYDNSDFPVTIVRPSHTYDEANPPIPGGWTAVDRIAKGEEIAVHGDGTSLWTLTHAADFAVGLIGLVGNPRTIGEVFHITSSDVYTWDQIYSIMSSALGVEPRLIHVPAEFFPVAAPEWAWSELVLGDLSHSALFDTTKIRRFVPTFQPTRSFHSAARDMVAWRSEHPVEGAADPVVEKALARLVSGYHQAIEVFKSESAPVTD